MVGSNLGIEPGVEVARRGSCSGTGTEASAPQDLQYWGLPRILPREARLSPVEANRRQSKRNEASADAVDTARGLVNPIRHLILQFRCCPGARHVTLAVLQPQLKKL